MINQIGLQKSTPKGKVGSQSGKEEGTKEIGFQSWIRGQAFYRNFGTAIEKLGS